MLMQLAAATAAKGTNLYEIQNRKKYIMNHIMSIKEYYLFFFQIYKR